MLTKTLIGKKSRWAGKDKPDAPEKAAEVIRNAGKFDPTNGGYLMFIVRDIALGRIRLPEDGPPLKDVLETFSKASKKGNWSGHKDIMQYSDWRELQRHTMEWSKTQEEEPPTSERAWIKQAKEGAEKIIDTTVNTTTGPIEYSAVEARTPVAVTVYGRGTQWCTSCSLFKTIPANQLDQTVSSLVQQKQPVEGDPWAKMTAEDAKKLIVDLNDGDLSKKELKVPNPYYTSALSNAKSYLRGGPMYIIFKNKQPYIQMTNSGRELRNVNDVSLRTPSPALAKVFDEMIKSGKMSSEMIKVLGSHIDRSGLRQLEAQQSQQPQQPQPGSQA